MKLDSKVLLLAVCGSFYVSFCSRLGFGSSSGECGAELAAVQPPEGQKHGNSEQEELGRLKAQHSTEQLKAHIQSQVSDLETRLGAAKECLSKIQDQKTLSGEIKDQISIAMVFISTAGYDLKYATIKLENSCIEMAQDYISKVQSRLVKAQDQIINIQKQVAEAQTATIADQKAVPEDQKAVAEDQKAVAEDQKTTTEDRKATMGDRKATTVDQKTIGKDEVVKDKVVKGEKPIINDQKTSQG